MHLVAEGLDVAQTCVLCFENGLVCDVEVEESFLSEVVSTQLLGFFLENLREGLYELLGLVPVAG